MMFSWLEITAAAFGLSVILISFAFLPERTCKNLYIPHQLAAKSMFLYKKIMRFINQFRQKF
ncbi:hypothetical protein ACFX4Y_08760 [Priestia sp. YIM B13446]|jgi:hypothetical protein|nr:MULTISPECIES: hypothetical protein [Priestia]RCX25474.1 hypothetical protein DEU47_103493 [Bacillus sp. AG236]KWU63955.1 hypothetical protein AWX17_01735 [Priestia megaterium]MBX9994394.1 hypothetical protein [Priestia aryabhattai]MCP1451711.1 hypothetical protein [Priestia megaterium]MDC7722039.1 hypothetical protein [Priestia megaterium]